MEGRDGKEGGRRERVKGRREKGKGGQTPSRNGLTLELDLPNRYGNESHPGIAI